MDVERFLRDQAGVISRAQALAAGLSEYAVDRRLSAGRWLRLHPRVYLAAGYPYTAEARLRSAVLWAGRSAVGSGVSAAWWHDMGVAAPPNVSVTVPAARRIRTRPGVDVRRRDLPVEDVTTRAGLPVTAVPLTVLEAAVALGEDGPRLLDRALQRRVTFPDLRRAHCRNLGRHGSSAAAVLLRAAGDGAASEAERRLVRLLRRAGVTGWVLGHPAEGYLLDLAFPTIRVAIEVDGWAWHSDVDRFRADRRRQNALVAAGWTVLRFTWHDLGHRPGAVVAEISRVIATRAA